MIINNTCVSGNDTAACSAPGSSAGLAAGLTIFFLLLVIVAAALAYKYHGKIRNIWLQPEQKKEDYTETTQVNPHVYTSMISEQPTGQNPIYENLTRKTGGNRRSVHQERPPSVPEEDVYLECDLPDDDDDAIYNNDPVCDLSIHPCSLEEDVYIVPDS